MVDDNENIKQNILNKYAWVPPGLEADLVSYFFSKTQV